MRSNYVPIGKRCPHGLDNSSCYTCTTAQNYWDNYRPKESLNKEIAMSPGNPSNKTTAPYSNQSHLHLLSPEDSTKVNSRLSERIKNHPLKSLQVRETYRPGAPEPANYSSLQILHSPAGYYLGTVYIDPDQMFEEPGSRDTSYFKTLDQAIRALECMVTLAISGNSSYPFDVAHWERQMTFEFKHNVRYRYAP